MRPLGTVYNLCFKGLFDAVWVFLPIQKAAKVLYINKYKKIFLILLTKYSSFVKYIHTGKFAFWESMQSLKQIRKITLWFSYPFLFTQT